MDTQLKVVKADGSQEDYLHTKIIGTINSALACIDTSDLELAEQLSQVVTYYIYRNNRHSITSNEIFSIIKAVLASTPYEAAAAELTKHHFLRKLRRSRIEVISTQENDLNDVLAGKTHKYVSEGLWNKSKIVSFLTELHNLDCQTARTIASMVEEKVLGLSQTKISTKLIKQFILADAEGVLRAGKFFQTT